VLGIRRVEKMIHALLSVVIFALAASGILIYHYGEFMAPAYHDVYRYFHITIGIALVLMPALYYLADKKHFKQVIHRAFKFNMDDVRWVQGIWAHLKRPNRFPMPYWGEFNTYQKFWYLYLSCIIPIFALTGLIKFFAGLNDTKAVWLSVAMTIHVAAAFCTDVLVFIHIYIKYLKHIGRICKDMLISWRSKKNLQYAFLYAPKTENQYSNIPDTFKKN
jgi:cytochrome b subunit of formate dehydrogenase